MTFDYFTTRLRATLMRSGIHGPASRYADQPNVTLVQTQSLDPYIRFFIGPDEFRKILASVDQVDTEENVAEETLTEKLSQVTLKHEVTVTSQVSDVITSQEKRVPKLNKKSFLFGEINSILESRKPTAEDKDCLKIGDTPF